MKRKPLKGQKMNYSILLITSLVLIGALTGCSGETDEPKTPVTASQAGVPTEVVALDNAGFASHIASGVVIVDFWAEWCGPCRVQGPIMEELVTALAQAGKHAGVAKVDVDAAEDVAKMYGIKSIPTLIVFKDGKPFKQFTGVTQVTDMMKALTAALDS